MIASWVGIQLQQDLSKRHLTSQRRHFNISHKKNQRFTLWKEPLEKG
jgi:hypothetical protein